jgi:hypothetical protein
MQMISNIFILYNTRKIKVVRFLTVTLIVLLGTVGILSAQDLDNEWSLSLSGNHESAITKEEYEEGINAEQESNQFSSVVDAQGQVWDGMPLWRLVNRVNDISSTDYSVTITGSDGASVTLPASEITGNDAFILANTKNGKPISLTDPTYPLVLAGKSLPINEMITGVSSVTLNQPIFS